MGSFFKCSAFVKLAPTAVRLCYHLSGTHMIRLEDLQPKAAVRGVLPDSLVTVVYVQWFGSEALELTY